MFGLITWFLSNMRLFKMKKKTIGILLMIFLVMIISIGAISAADANETLQGEVSDTNIALADEVDDANVAAASSALEQNVNATSLRSDSVSDIEEVSVDDSRDENHKVEKASSASDDVLSASNDDLLGENPNFYYAGKWYGNLNEAVSDACDNGGGTIKLTGKLNNGAWGYDSAEREITISKGVSITFEPNNPNDFVAFDGKDYDNNIETRWWFFKIDDANAHITFTNITFRNGGDGSLASDGGALRIIHGQVTLNNCIFNANKVYSNSFEGFGWGGAIFLDEEDASLIANNCRFTNNYAKNGGGAVCVEDGASATFNYCYFKDNSASEGDDVHDKDGGSHSFSYCYFMGSGSIDYNVNIFDKTVTLTPNVDNSDVNYAILYKDGEIYDKIPCNPYDTVTFGKDISIEHPPLVHGTYTIYMMKNEEIIYEYSGTTFSIVEPNFVLNDEKAFETLTEAVNAISNGGSGVITVERDTFTDSANFNVVISNKDVTIMPKDYLSAETEDVIFSGNSQSYLLYVNSNSKLTIQGITIKGKFSDSALKFNTNLECTISDCEFENIQGNPINAQNSKLALDGSTFESNGPVLFKNSVVNINDCTFDSNSGVQGGAINADSSTDLTINGSEFTSNEASEKGGAIYASNLKIDETVFKLNSAPLGGAVYITGSTDSLINITDSVFDSNLATNYRNIYSESLTRKVNLEFNEYDLNLTLIPKDAAYGANYILEGYFDWGSNLNSTYVLVTGMLDDKDLFGDLLTVVDNKFKISMGALSGGSHIFTMDGMYTQDKGHEHFPLHAYYADLYQNHFYLDLDAMGYAKILIDKGNITLNLEVKNVLIPETPVLNVYANWDLNYTIFVGNKYYQVEVVNGKGSMQLTGLDLGNHTVVAMRDADKNFNLAMNFTTFAISKTYSNFIVLSTNVEYDTLNEAVANSNNEDVIYIKNGTYTNTGIVISNKTLDIIALEGAVFDAQGKDANFIIVDRKSEVYIYGITFRGLHNRNTNYGAIVNHGDLTVESCNFTDNKITKTSFAQNGGAAIFSDGESLDIGGCNFINNVAPLKVSTAAVTSLGEEDVSIIDSKFINNSAREGGAVHFKNLAQYTDAIFSCDFEQNVAVKGSAIYAGNNSKYLSVGLSNFKKNDIKNSLGEKAQLEGGVIYVNSNTGGAVLDISTSNFKDNSNSNVDGGVICLDGNSKAYIDSSVFTNNKGKLGSVILIKNPYNNKLTLFIVGSNFVDNNATMGAIATSPNVSTFIDECVFANNTGENRHIYSNGFTVVHDSIFDVKDVKLTALSVQYGQNAVITGIADIGTNIYAAANLTVAGENISADIKNNTFTYDAGMLNHGKYYAVLNSIQDANDNTYLMDGITQIFRVNRVPIELNVSVDNITYGETLNVVEKLPSYVMGTIDYQLNGRYYSKEEVESLILDAGNYTLVAFYDHEDFAFSSTIVNFEVYKANPTINVADVEVIYGESIIINIETNVPSIYTIEVGDYKTIKFINGSGAIEIENTFMPGNYTINVTSQKRINYISNSTEAVLRVNKNIPVFTLSLSDKVTYPGDAIIKVLAPEDAEGNISYGIVDADNNIVYTITLPCSEDLIIPGLDAGIYDVVGVFEGDDIYNSTDDIQLTFMVYKSDVNLTLQYNNITFGEDLVITPKFNMPNVEGTITYVIGNTIKTLPVNERYVLSGLEEGNYNLVAFYMGSNNYNSCKFLATVNVRKSNTLLGTFNNIHNRLLGASLSARQSAVDDTINVNSEDILSFSFIEENLNVLKSNGDLLAFSGNDIIADEYDEYRFLYQYDEDDDYSYFETLEDAVDEAVSWGAGIITVRGGTYSVSSIDIEGEIELTIKAFENETVIFDCGGDDYFMLLTYDTEVEWVQVPPPPHPEEEQTEGPTVTLENITIINGYANYGGAIDLEAGSLTLMNCNFDNNRADIEGGAIYIGKWDAENEATLIAVNTTFTNNHAAGEGGAIYIASDNLDGQETSASFYLCTFLDNYQGEGEDRIINYFAGGNAEDIVRQYCVFNGNGEIYDFRIDKINQTVYVKGNSVDSFDSVVLLYDDQLPLYTIYNNGSRDFNVTFEDVMGGNYTVGVMNDHDFNTYIFKDYRFEMIVPNFIISSEEVYENLTDAIDAVGENGIIYANVNYYDEDNMQIEIHKSFTLKNFKDGGVVFDGSSALWFFTIANGCTVVFDGISFTDGGIKDHASIENYGTLIITNCSFEAFETDEIIYNSGLMNILNSTFSLNLVDNALVWNEKDLVIHTVEFSSNRVNVSSVVYNNGAADIISSNFTDNYNGGNGGAVYNKNKLFINGTVFSENEGYNGGVIYNEGRILEVVNSSFEDNTANGYGGAIFNDGTEARIYNSSFTGGSSEKDGGAIYNNNNMIVDNSTFVGNSANVLGGAIYNNKTLVLTKSLFGINFAEEFANIYNARDIQFSENIFDFYDVILLVPDGQYGLPTTIAGTLDPQFNMDIQVTLPSFVNNKDATVTISEGVFEYVTDILPKGVYDVILNEIIYDNYGNIYYGEAIFDRLIVHKANVYINMTIDDIIIKGSSHEAPVLRISVSKDGEIRILFNNKFITKTITGGKAEITLDKVDEGNYTVFAVREGDENYNDAVNTTSFLVKEYEGNFIVNSTGGQFDTLKEAIENSAADDIIYVREGNYTGENNLGLEIFDKKLTIISLGDVVFDGDSTDLYFLTVGFNSNVTICDVVVSGFNTKNKASIIENNGALTLDGCVIVNNTYGDECRQIIYNSGELNITESEFYNNIAEYYLIKSGSRLIIINESTFENNTCGIALVSISNAEDSAKIISSEFVGNNVSEAIIEASNCRDVLISSEFYNNTQGVDVILAMGVSNLLVENSIFMGNDMETIIVGDHNDQNIISGSIFTENTVKNVVLSKDKNLSVIDSIFTGNTLSGEGALYIASEMDASVNGCVFSNNKADNYRNIYSVVSDLNITNTTFDAINVDFTVHDIDYGENETIEGTIDIGTNLKFTVNFEIGSKTYSVNVTNKKFTLNAGILNGGDYNVVLTANGDNSNEYVFDKITKIFTVNRIDPGLNVTIANITQGEKLNVTLNINKTASARVAYELNGKFYTKEQLENLTLDHGTYLIVAMYRGDKNFLPVNEVIALKVFKVAPNITLNNVSVNYNDEIKINVTVDVADFYTVFLGNKNITLYVKDNATFTFSGEEFKPGSYEIRAYVFETDEYAESYGNATLTVNKASGIFNLSNDTIIYGENAIICVEIPVNAYGNITYEIYDKDGKLVYTITQSCYKDLEVPNLSVGNYTVKGTFEGDFYYSDESIINSATISVDTQDVGLKIIVSNIDYTENANITVKANVDDDYLVYVGGKPSTVTVKNGTGNLLVSGLTVGSYAVNATVIDGNYSGFDEAVFEVAIKQVSVVVSVGNITYEDNVTVTLNADVDGDYLVYVGDKAFTVTVENGTGNLSVSGLTVGSYAVNATVIDGNYSGFDEAVFEVAVKQVSVVVSVGNITYEDNATVIVQADVDGDYIVNIRGINYTVSVNEGTGVKEIPNLSVGDSIAVTVMRDDNYTGFNSTTFAIAIKPIDIQISVENITHIEDETIVVQSEADGEYLVYVNNDTYTVNVIGGIGSITFYKLPTGNYTVNVTVLNGNYTGFNSTEFEVIPANVSMDVYFENKTYGTSSFVVILPSDATGNVSVYVNGVFSQNVDLVNGSTIIIVNNLIDDDNNVTLVYNGDSNYVPVNESVIVNRMSTLDASDMTRGYNSGVDYTAKLLDGNGNPLVNETVTIKVGTKTYAIKTDSDGVLKFNDKLAPGDYAVAIVNPATAEYKLTNLTIVKRIAGNKDVSIFFADGSNYKVRIIGDDGKYVGAGEIVKMNVGGKTYSVKTDKNGYANLKLSLKVKKHTITVTYKGFTTKNKVTVKSVVKPVKKTVKVKKTAKRLKIKVKLKGKKVLKKKRVYLKFKGKTYKAKTNKRGIATFKVPKKVINKLKKGKKYRAVFTYKAKANGKTIKNTAKCFVKVR